MCELIKWETGGYVADIKHKYILNIANRAKECKNISRIMLFGSATETRCTEKSDIDIAVFGDISRNEYLRSNEFKNFQQQIFSFANDFSQDYDILYFCNKKNYNDAILKNVIRGTEIYRRTEK